MHNTAEIALDFVDQVIELDDDATVCDLLLKHARGLGFQDVAVCELPFSGRPMRLVCTWPAGFCKLYLTSLYQDDPLARHACETTEPFVWSQVSWDRSRGSRAQRVLDEAAAVGLEDGFIVPVIGVDGDQSALGLAGPRIQLNATDRHGLHLMCIFAHYAIWRRRSAVCGKRLDGRLSQAQQDALKYAMFGRLQDRAWEPSRFAAREVGEIHRSACARFGAGSVTEAGCIAFLRGEITP